MVSGQQQQQIMTNDNSLVDGPLLPENIANIVTAVSLATRISLRCSSLFFDAIFEAAKYGTSVSLGISRNALTNAISTAKNLHYTSNENLICSSLTEDHDRLFQNNNLFIKVLEKYTNIGLYLISHTFSLAELFAMSGIQFTARTIQSSLKAAEESVRIVDGIFGSNETSRAIASFISLVHRELHQDPEFELAKLGRIAILAGLTKAMTAFAVLQNVTHKRMMKQIPMTILWEGVITDEKDDGDTNKIIQFKKKKSMHPQPRITKSNYSSLNDDKIVIQELNALLQQEQRRNQQPLIASARTKEDDSAQEDIVTTTTTTTANGDKMYKVTTKTSCITTKTTTICPIDSLYSKRIVVRTDEEENGSFLATLVNESTVDPQFILSSLSEKRRKRKVERQEGFDYYTSSTEDLKTPTEEKYNQHRRRFSSPDHHYSNINSNSSSFDNLVELSQSSSKRTTKLYEKGQESLIKKARQRHSSISSISSTSSCLITTTTISDNNLNHTNNHIYKKRSNSISNCTTSNSILAMTTYNTPIPTPSSSSRSKYSMTNNNEEDMNNSNSSNIMYYDHGWNFPQNHIVNNIAHFMRYASAAYGESFMRILGIGDIPTVLPSSHHHHPNHHAFAHHTGNSVEDILLSSYTDRSPLHLHNPSIHALVHYVTVDHAAKAIVLTCRGTLGLSDILTDLSMDYSEFSLPNDSSKIFKAHSGMLDAAQLLAKEKGKVYQKIRQGLESYPEYGLVMCGHSLGGGVASLLCVLWSQQNHDTDNLMPSFVTSSQSGLPAGRPIHCYAYGPPGVMSLSLSTYCSGLVTSIVHGYDVVSSLSLGLLKDFKNVATSLHVESDVAEEIISRVVGRMQKKKNNQQVNEDEEGELTEDDQWFWAMIKTMRADMTSEKMYPPSTVYLIETIPYIKQQHKVVLCRCEDVQARFSEIVFTRTMFMDHSPLMYERAIRRLCQSFNNE